MHLGLSARLRRARALCLLQLQLLLLLLSVALKSLWEPHNGGAAGREACVKRAAQWAAWQVWRPTGLRGPRSRASRHHTAWPAAS